MKERSRNPGPDGRALYTPRIKDLPLDERPRERLLRYGVGSLSNAELLAIILRTGTASEMATHLAERLIVRFGGLPGLARASAAELCQEHGIGEAKTAQLKAALELGRRLLLAQPEEKPQVRSPGDVAALLMSEMAFLEQEHLKVVLLDVKNHVQAISLVYQGSVNRSVIRVSELFRDAIKRNCAAIIVAHNHPSGDPTPSPEDVSVTEQVIAAGKLLDIDVLDHLVIGHRRYISLKEQGLGFR